MNIIKTDIEGLLILEPKVFGDSRGYFFEVFNRREFAAAVSDVNFVQDNESMAGTCTALNTKPKRTSTSAGSW